MLNTCGERSLDDLYKDVPEELVLKREYGSIRLSKSTPTE